MILLVWKNLQTGELIDGAVPFLPPTRAVYARRTAGGLEEVDRETSDSLNAYRAGSPGINPIIEGSWAT